MGQAFASVTQAVLVLLFLPFLLHAFRNSGFELRNSAQILVWLALTGFIFGALALTRHMPDGVTLQYSGAAFLALTLGYHRALLSMALLLLIVRPISEWGVSLWIDALLPVWLMVWLVAMSRRFLPANPFVFLLGCSFIGLFAVSAVQKVAGTIAEALGQGLPAFSLLYSEQTAWSLLLVSGEATLEGMIITLLVVYYPQAVRLFDDQFYLSRPM